MFIPEVWNVKKNTIRACFLSGILLLAVSLAPAQTLNIPQIVDGGVWQTTIALTNTTANPTTVGLSFFQETSGGSTSNWALAFMENVQTPAILLAPGNTLFLHTLGTAASTTIGWGQVREVDNAAAVVAYAIFTERGTGLQSGTAPATAAVSRVLVPFDNTGPVTSMAIVNSTLSNETINVGIRVANAPDVQTTIALPADGHMAFALATQFPTTGRQSGLVEFYAPSGSFSILAFRGQSTSFTTAPVYDVSGPPVIASASSGGSPNIIFAGFSIGKVNSNGGSFTASNQGTDIMGGDFGSFTPTEWNLPFAATAVGPSCTVLDVTYLTGGKTPYAADVFLDAGNISFSGAGVPSGAALLKTATAAGPFYSYLPTSPIFQLGQAYSISSAGGPQVNAFTTTSAAIPSSFAVTNWDSITSINRALPLSINWTGSGISQVGISVLSETFGINTHAVTVECVVSASLGMFSVPAAALVMLPGIQSGAANTAGILSVKAGDFGSGPVSISSDSATTFTPTLVGGGQANYGNFGSYLAVTKSVSIQ
jgi:hypothetical protein